jgi:hypothetical protein
MHDRDVGLGAGAGEVGSFLDGLEKLRLIRC